MWVIVLTILNSSQQSSKKENGIFQIGNSTWLTTVKAHHPSSPLSAPLKAGNHLGSFSNGLCVQVGPENQRCEAKRQVLRDGHAPRVWAESW